MKDFISSAVGNDPRHYSFDRTYPAGLTREPDGSWFKLIIPLAILAGVLVLFAVLAGLPLY